MDEEKKHINPNPITKANFLSRLFYCWLNPLFKIGDERSLEIKDVYNVLKEDSSKYLCDRLEKNWNRELFQVKVGKTPSLRWAMIRTFGLQYSIWFILIFFEEAVRVIQPLFLGGLIRYFRSNSQMELWEGFLYAGAISVCAIIPAITHHPYFLAVTRFGMWLRIATCSLVYKKCLRLSSGSLGKTTTGQIINLMSNDVMRFDQSLMLLHFLIIGPLELIAVFVLLWLFISWSTIAGLGVLILFFPVSLILSKVFVQMRSKTAILTDERVRLMNEVLNAVRIVKMYCWEAVFKERISEARKQEVSRILKISYARVATIAPFFFSGKVIVYFTFLPYILAGNKLTAEVVFVTLSLYNPLRLTMTFFFPLAIQAGSEMLVTIQRLQNFLLLEEMDPSSIPFEPSSNMEPRAVVVNIEASWDSTHSIFKNISFEVGPGELLAIIGPVGVGKSSLLMAMLGELPLKDGKINISGKIGYVSQQPWVFNASVRQNITFGAQFDAAKYKRVIQAAALIRDLDAMPEGDMTLVGDRGASLSGGQKARVSLARALYYDADVYILDDPLSAVDAKVANHIFYKCICGLLRNKPRILVTHQLQYLEKTDKILILSGDEDYKLGSISELSLCGVDIVSLLRCYSSAESSQPEARSMRQESLAYNRDSEMDISVDVVPDIKVTASHQKNLARFSKSHGHINFLSSGWKKNEQSTALLSTSLDNQQQSLLNEFEESVQKVSCHLSIDRLSPVPAVNLTKSVHSFGSIFSINELPDFVPPVRAEETRAGGTVSPKIYWEYFYHGGGIFSIFLFAFLNITAHVTFILADWWLAYWCTRIEQHEQYLQSVNSSADQLTNSSVPVTKTNSVEFPDSMTYLFVFTGICASVVIFGILRAVHGFYILVMSSVRLHEKMLDCILRCPISFFDNNPIGRILNRFAKDLGQMDESLPLIFSDFIVCFLLVVGIILLTATVIPWVIIPIVPLGAVFIYLRRYYLRTTRDIKRMEATTKSPVFSHISTTVLGIQNIRAYCAQTIFINEFDAHQDLHTSTFFLFLVLGRWFAVRLEFLSALFITSVSICCVLAAQSLDGSMVGLSLSYAITLMALFQWCVRQSSEVENMMTTVERIIEYTKLEPEAILETPGDRKLPPDWPNAGAITANDVFLRYSPDGHPVLKNLTFQIHPKEKIGIVGRTGAGKSSLITLLFRLVEPEGKLCIDGIDITTIGLHDIRKHISIIPQDPVLLNGSIHRNLDPTGKHSVAEIWQALNQVQLYSAIEEMSAGLDSPIHEGGANISMGQRQLICLARAILGSNKILVIDEATANVDPRTDALIQRAIHEQFQHCTVLTIAHRLNTIINSDRIMVLEGGQIVEFDSPYNLLQNQNGLFYQMVQQTGPCEFNQLSQMAAKSAQRNLNILPSNGYVTSPTDVFDVTYDTA